MLAQLVAINISLWVGGGWHFDYDWVSLSTGDDLTKPAFVGLATATALLTAFATSASRTVSR